MATRTRRGPGRPAGGRPVVDREQLLDIAERVIRRDGAGASLDAIANEAGVTKPIVYARVGGRVELSNALAARLADRLVASSDSARDERRGREALAGFLRSSLETLAEHRELFFYVTRGTTDDTPQRALYLAERSATPMAEAFTRMRQHHGRDTAVAEPWAYAVIGMLNLVAQWWLLESDGSAEVLADQLATLLWSGLSAEQ